MFETGWVPTGWTRGQPLEIRRGDNAALVVPEVRATVPGQVYCVAFDIREDELQVREWLRWWYAIEQMGT